MSTIRDELLALYAIDQKLLQIKAHLQTGPEECKRLRQEVEAAKAAKRDVETRVRETASGVDRLNLEAKEAEDEIAQQQDKLHAIKNTKEYRIVTERIKNLKQQIADVEERELDLMERLDSLRLSLKEKQEALAAAEAACEEKEASIERMGQTVKGDQRALVAERTAQIARIDVAVPEAMPLYSQALRRGKGKALAILRNGACQECFQRQSPNVTNLVLLGTQLAKCVCPGCGRLLIADETELAAVGNGGR